LNEAGYWAQVLDTSWRIVYMTDELVGFWAKAGFSAAPVIGKHYFSAEAVQFRKAYGGIHAVRESYRTFFLNLAPYVLASTPGGRDELRGVVDPDLVDLVEGLRPREIPVMWVVRPQWGVMETSVAGSQREGSTAGLLLWQRIDDGRGPLAGLCTLAKPAAGMTQIAVMTASADARISSAYSLSDNLLAELQPF
jgi:hypothetical protein